MKIIGLTGPFSLDGVRFSPTGRIRVYQSRVSGISLIHDSFLLSREEEEYLRGTPDQLLSPEELAVATAIQDTLDRA